jgi:hypothetical protein
MNPAEWERVEKLAQIFLPYAMQRKRHMQENRLKFAHYTSAENGLRILREKRVMMRNTLCINDYREFEHGLSYIGEFFKDETSRSNFLNSLNSCCAGVAEEAVKLFDTWLPHNRFNVYVSCFSEHKPEENRFGRLSMWRAYRTGTVGVALVFHNEPFWQRSTVLKTVNSPVAYVNADQFKATLNNILRNVAQEGEFLKSVPRQQLVGVVFNMLMYAAACAKHPGFAEEQEWRLVYLPKMGETDALEKGVDVINGVPQTVYRIPLKDRPQDELIGIEIPSLLERVIIGPSNFPWPLYEAFVTVLKEAGVQNAEEKVIPSDIPLRS